MSESKRVQYPTINAFVASSCQAAGTSLERVVVDAGLGKENIAKLMLDGLIKMPVAWIKPLALALTVDPVHLLRLYLSDYMPELLALQDEFAVQPLLTQNERKLIASLRQHTAGTDAQAIVADGRDLIAVVMV